MIEVTTLWGKQCITYYKTIYVIVSRNGLLHMDTLHKYGKGVITSVDTCANMENE
jgi:hypothetical protein